MQIPTPAKQFGIKANMEQDPKVDRITDELKSKQ